MRRTYLCLQSLIMIVGLIANSTVLLAYSCCNNTIAVNTQCQDIEDVGICEDQPAGCPAMPSCNDMTRKYYPFEPDHECGADLTTNTLCIVGEERDLCYFESACYLEIVDGMMVCVHDILGGFCTEEYVYVAENFVCVPCGG